MKLGGDKKVSSSQFKRGKLRVAETYQGNQVILYIYTNYLITQSPHTLLAWPLPTPPKSGQ